MRSKLNILKYGLSIFILVFLVSKGTKIDWKILFETNIFFIVLGSLLNFIYYLTKSLRFYYLLSRFFIEINFFKLFILTIFSIGIGSITPAKIGEVSKAIGFSDKKDSAASLTLFELFIDLLVLIMLFSMAIIFLNKDFLLPKIFFIFIPFFIFAFLFLSLKYEEKTDKLFMIFFKIRYFSKLKDTYKLLKDFHVVFIAVLASIIILFIGAIQMYIAFHSVGVDISYLTAIILIISGTFIASFSGVPAGIGVKDGAIGYLVQILEGIPIENAIIPVIIYRIITTLSLLFYGWIASMFIKEDDM